MGEKLERFWNSWPGIIAMFAIVAVIYGFMHFSHPQGVTGFIKEAVSPDVTYEVVERTSPQ